MFHGRKKYFYAPWRLSRPVVPIDCVDKIRAEFMEQRDRLIRLNNLVIYGVPESSDGLSLATDLMKILLPSFNGPVVDVRLGPKPMNPAATTRPRPLRIALNSANEQIIALKNRRKLKGMDIFKGISLNQDLTKKQQEEIRRAYLESQNSQMETDSANPPNKNSRQTRKRKAVLYQDESTKRNKSS